MKELKNLLKMYKEYGITIKRCDIEVFTAAAHSAKTIYMNRLLLSEFGADYIFNALSRELGNYFASEEISKYKEQYGSQYDDSTELNRIKVERADMATAVIRDFCRYA